MSDNWEVEQKYRVDSQEELQQLLKLAGFEILETVRQCDSYFRHPSRDFRVTDEALRLRRVNGTEEEASFITYKGPRQAGPVKTRKEIEIPFGSSDFESWATLLSELGFERLPDVVKNRAVWRSQQARNTGVTVAVDYVEGLGAFAEVELVLSATAGFEAAASHVTRVGTVLGLRNVESRSYLEMLLQKQGLE